MGENTIFVKHYNAADDLFPINEREIARYAGYFGIPEDMDEETRRLMHEVIDEMKDVISFKVCYRRMDVVWENESPKLLLDESLDSQRDFLAQSKLLTECIAGSREVILFAATAGLGIDRYITRNQRIAPTKALFAQAYGAERVESLCDGFCREIDAWVGAQGLSCTARFSPGYGDLPLSAQKDVFRLLDCNKQIGISLGESLLMTPSKSVTAIFGIGECVGVKHKHRNKCEACNNKDCEFRSVEEI